MIQISILTLNLSLSHVISIHNLLKLSPFLETLRNYEIGYEVRAYISAGCWTEYSALDVEEQHCCCRCSTKHCGCSQSYSLLRQEEMGCRRGASHFQKVEIHLAKISDVLNVGLIFIIKHLQIFITL